MATTVEAPDARPKRAKTTLPEGMRKRGKVYYAWFRFRGKSVCKRLSAQLSVAKTMLNDLKGRLERGEWGILDNDCPWAEVKEQYVDHAKQTLRDVEQALTTVKRFERFRAVTNVKQIDHKYVVAYREWRLQQRIGKPPKKGEKDARPFVNPRTVNREVGALSTILNKAVAWGLIGSNPIAKAKPLRNDNPAKQRRPLTVEEVEALFAASPQHLHPVWRFFMVTGMRRNEVVELRFSDVDFERRVVMVSAERAKNHKAREIPLDDATYATLADLREQAKHRKPVPGKTRKATEQQAASFSRDHVFVTTANTPWRNNLLTRFYVCCGKAGIEDAKRRGPIDLHSLRVTFTTLSIEHGASPKAIQDILGHSTLGLTMSVYAKATERAKRAAISALPFATVSAPKHVLQLVKQDETATVDKACTKVVAAT